MENIKKIKVRHLIYDVKKIEYIKTKNIAEDWAVTAKSEFDDFDRVFILTTKELNEVKL